MYRRDIALAPEDRRVTDRDHTNEGRQRAEFISAHDVFQPPVTRVGRRPKAKAARQSPISDPHSHQRHRDRGARPDHNIHALGYSRPK